jgi:CHASE2 domain-containing sensor protein
MYFGPFAWLVRGAAWLAGVGMLALALVTGALSPIDAALYDLHLRHWGYAPGDQVVIVAIDQESLATLGRWPWSRAQHARLIDRLREAGVAAIGFDVSIVDPETDDPAADRALVEAVRKSGHVVLPVYAEPGDLGGMPQETLPLPDLAKSAAALGHVDVARDDDGLVRGVYLKAGLGRAYWPAFALALASIGHDIDAAALRGERNPALQQASPYRWIRDGYALLRYAGPAGSFGRLSYADVLAGRIPASLLKGRCVLVGATAEGMGDIVQTPLSPMPGVEYQANVLEALRRHALATPLNLAAQFLLGSAMLAWPLVLFGLPGLRHVRITLPLAWLAMLAAGVALLRFAHWWWPPGACLAIVTVEAATWALLSRVRGTHSESVPA